MSNYCPLQTKLVLSSHKFKTAKVLLFRVDNVASSNSKATPTQK